MSGPFTTPSWVPQSVFYQIFPDRFARSATLPDPANLEPWDSPPTPHGFKGGDLAGVAEKLDYLQDLGITALYLNPIFQSASNHRYHTHDYRIVDPLLGGRPAFDRLLAQAHRRGIRVVLDGVFNHASRGFFPFHHLLEVGEVSPYADWFRVRSYPVRAYEGEPNYDCWWNLPALPTFNHANPEARRYLMDVARYWAEQGIDGWRLDVPSEIQVSGFWEEFRDVVKAVNPELYIVGEIAGDGSPWLRGDRFDGVMNYLLAYSCWSFFGGENLDRGLVEKWRVHAGDRLEPVRAREFADAVGELLRRYPSEAVLAQLNLLGSHDTARVRTITGSDWAVRLAVLFQMTYPGAPCVYYGDEIGLEGGDDPDCRGAFPWDERVWDRDLRAYVQGCIRLRRSRAALRGLVWVLLHAEGGVVGYARGKGGDTVVVILNTAAMPFHADLDVAGILDEGALLEDALGRGGTRVSSGRLRYAVPPRTGVALVAAAGA